jgi:homocysteine S-methyltransferase
MKWLRYATEFAGRVPVMVISGNLGPRGDGYVAQQLMSADVAEAYHGEQIRIFADNRSRHDLSIHAELHRGGHRHRARAANRYGMPSVISFTVETDGKLPSGQPLPEAIAEVDAATDGGPAYYMINCAHPTHFADLLASNAAWVHRIRGLRVNCPRDAATPS